MTYFADLSLEEPIKDKGGGVNQKHIANDA
jgi:hypothetical protein